LGVGAPAADPLGLLLFFCFTGAEAGRLVPGAKPVEQRKVSNQIPASMKKLEQADSRLHLANWADTRSRMQPRAA